MKNILLKEELLTIFKNKKVLIPIIAVMFVPVLYAGMFLWAFWDPYDKLDELPVAVVNEDAGATLDGDHLKLGDDLVTKLKKSKDFGFEYVDKKEGYKELKDQKYYMVIEIPKGFSKNATTLMDKDPKKLELIYTPNESFNFLSAQIGNTAAEKIKTAVAEKVTETYAETIFSKVSELADGIVKASDGAGQLKDGSVDLNKGSEDLNNGLATLAEKSIEFNNGVKTANSGSKALASGASELKDGLAKADATMPQLVDGTNQIAAGAEKLKTELPAGIAQGMQKELTGSAFELNKGIDQFETQLTKRLAVQIADQTITEQTEKMEKLANALIANGVSPQLVNAIMTAEPAPTKDAVQASIEAKLTPGIDAGFTQFKTGVNEKLLGATNGLDQKIKSQTDPYFDQLLAGIDQISSGQKQLQSGIGALSSGSVKLNDGTNTLSLGLNRLADGSNQLSAGTGQLADGSNQLKDGTTNLSDGAKELSDKLADGAKEASKVHSDDKTYNMMAEPVKLANEKINHVPNYGTGFAPYFISLGLFVGALLLSIVFPLRETAAAPSSGFNWFLSKFSIMAGVGIIQALLADAILLGGLGLDVQSVPKFILFSIITSLTFVALIQLFVSVFADAGRFLAIIVLIFQLTTSAGTFPLELIPNFLQHFNAFLPMTYSVSGFKAVISSGDLSFMWHNVTILLGFLVAFALGTIAYFTIRHKHQYKHQVNTLVSE
ncbi:YhgE/Pip C-terminal domain-containing protein [Neobacillus bataviensis LMG 21833]|uniref:YhgE/Pip C-terminal domain-containing protein n=1 Tax=Neobacillus bataviensis LMG 21833 TaxID=1117379 RepID=K6DPK7_9BACI|nr:YhgE/Pip domain-containing protein [Neobacillus bataviensis]EKN70269.1 YhgE/Pip C-terminal domain-containing protein [Neobacillus bataviensis LMG 21833]